MRGGVEPEIGRAAVQGDAGAHPVAGGQGLGRLRLVQVVAQHGCAVAQAALARKVGRGGLKAGGLVGNAQRAVGVAEVGHERDFVDLGQSVQACPGGARLGGRKAQAVHAAVDFEENTLWHVGFVRRQHIDLGFVMHHVPQVQARASL